MKQHTSSTDKTRLGPAAAPYSVSVIIPTLNEAANLPLVLPYLPLNLIHEVILVDGRSTDGTVEAARALLPSIKVVLEHAPGKGVALRRGYAAAQGDIIVVLDADGSNDPREIPRFLRALLEGADFVKGSRFAPLGGTSDMPRIRKLGNDGFVRLANLLFGSDFSDLCYGYHAFWRYCLDSINLEDIDGFEIDAAIYLRALQARLRIVDVPSFEGYRFYGVGKLKMIPDGWRVLRTILREWRSSLTAIPLPPYMGFRRAPDALRLELALARQVGNDSAEVVPSKTSSSPTLGRPPAEERSATLLPASGPSAHPLPVFLDLLVEMYTEPAETLNHQRLLRYVLAQALKNLGAPSGSLLVIDEHGAVIEGCLAYQSDYLSLTPPQCLEIFETGFAGWVANHRAPALVTNTQEDPRWLIRPWEASAQVSRSALGVPLLLGNRLFGVLTAAGPAGEAAFTEEHLQRLVGAAGQA